MRVTTNWSPKALSAGYSLPRNTVRENIVQMIGGLKAGMGYVGCRLH
jgi:IMP dehydrogenase/GMP reductase